MLMNGNGTYYCCPRLNKLCKGKSKLTTFNFEAGKSYKMSLVNTATSTHTTFWIDNHSFSVVATDFVPIKPYNASILNVAIGQRYDIIVEANATTHGGQTDFWMHARDCAIGGARSNLGIIRYDPSSKTIPFTPPPDAKHICYGCLDELSLNLKPIVPRNVTAPANGNFTKDSFKVHLVGYPDEHRADSLLHKWVLKDSSFYLDWSEPSLSLVKIASDKGWKEPKFPKGYEPVNLDYEEDSWVYFLIEGKFQDSLDNSTRKIYKTQAPVAHPIHVHGHDFVVLASDDKEFNASEVKLDLYNPPRRDVALLPVDGYLIIAFQSKHVLNFSFCQYLTSIVVNNPGIWLMHCHVRISMPAPVWDLAYLYSSLGMPAVDLRFNSSSRQTRSDLRSRNPASCPSTRRRVPTGVHTTPCLTRTTTPCRKTRVSDVSSSLVEPAYLDS
jgi:hypothetical protein